MLPFLNKSKEASVSAAPESIKREPDQEQDYDALESAVSDLFDAYKSNDVKAGCVALRAAIEILDSEPSGELLEE